MRGCRLLHAKGILGPWQFDAPQRGISALHILLVERNHITSLGVHSTKSQFPCAFGVKDETAAVFSDRNDEMPAFLFLHILRLRFDGEYGTPDFRKSMLQ